MGSIALFGGGVMGETILAGLLRSGHAAANLVVVERRAERAAELQDRYAIRTVDNGVAAQADTIILVVKPADVVSLLGEIGPRITQDSLVVSLAAGVRTSTIEAQLSEGTAVVRVMPNTPALVGEGMSVISPGQSCSEVQLAESEALMSAVGRVARVPEQQQDAVTAVSGSGPAYVLLLIEKMVAAGVELGLSKLTATELAGQTVLGTAKLLRETGADPALLREQVTSPGGTTAAAIAKFEADGVGDTVLAAMTAARDRSVELGA